MKSAKRVAKAPNAITLLRTDHAEVKKLFDVFEKSKNEEKKQAIADQAMMALRIHAAIEEEIFYPALRARLKKEDILNEAEEEHRVAKTLIEDLSKKGRRTENFEAKFTVLAENVRHHIKEEEGDMFKKARAAKLNLGELGAQLISRKQELMGNEQALTSAEAGSQVKPYQEL